MFNRLSRHLCTFVLFLFWVHDTLLFSFVLGSKLLVFGLQIIDVWSRKVDEGQLSCSRGPYSCLGQLTAPHTLLQALLFWRSVSVVQWQGQHLCAAGLG